MCKFCSRGGCPPPLCRGTPRHKKTSPEISFLNSQNMKNRIRLSAFAAIAAFGLCSISLFWWEHNRDYATWEGPVVLPGGAALEVRVFSVRSDTRPSQNQFKFSIADAAFSPAQWESIGDGRFVLMPLGIYMNEAGAPRLVTTIAGGSFDYSPYKLPRGCSAYYVFQLEPASGWVYDPQGPTDRDKQAFRDSFNLYPHPIRRDAVAENELSPKLQRLAPTALAHSVFEYQPCPSK